LISQHDIISATMNKKHRRTLAAVFDDPVRSNISWQDIVGLLVALGAELLEGRGSRLRVALRGEKAIFYRPHPEKECDKGMVKSIRRFLIQAGVTGPIEE
jgi:hypothetical protein